MQFSQSVTYAVQSLIQLSSLEAGMFITRVKLASRGNMRERFLLDVLQNLVKRGVLCSLRGGGGGFALARHASEITLLDIVEAVDGPIEAGLPKDANLPEPVRTWLQKHLERTVEALRTQLNNMTLQHIVKLGGSFQFPTEGAA